MACAVLQSRVAKAMIDFLKERSESLAGANAVLLKAYQKGLTDLEAASARETVEEHSTVLKEQLDSAKQVFADFKKELLDDILVITGMAPKRR